MKDWSKPTLLFTFLTAICACQPANTEFQSGPEADFELAWLLGCWVSENGDTEESWQRSREGSQLFGYSVTRSPDGQHFFEQLRLDRDTAGWSLFAYPRGIGPTRFDGAIDDAGALVLLNPSHDYPQRIAYQATDEGMIATVSLADGSNRNQWRYARCTPG